MTNRRRTAQVGGFGLRAGGLPVLGLVEVVSRGGLLGLGPVVARGGLTGLGSLSRGGLLGLGPVARGGFTGRRVVTGCYVTRDDWMSRARLLRVV